LVGLLFPGQGSQHVGMGRDVAEAYPEARQTFEEADDTLGTPLTRLCWEGPEEELTATHNAQPALLTHSLAVLRVIRERVGKVALGAGHSLGEFTAYAAAGSLDFRDALRVVRRRGELMYRSGQERPGTMAVLLGLEDEAVERVCTEASARGGECVPANYNGPGQVVISGDVPTVELAMQLAKDAGAKRSIRLNVSGGFHSPLMIAAEAGLDAELASVSIRVPDFPIVSNVTAKPVSDPVTARRLLIQQLTSPVQWTRSMQTMASAGVRQVIELGPGNVLAGLMKRIDKSVEARSIGKRAEIVSFLS
jgi:[acyl-carrier-protein] S-malonyltransferase